MAYGESRKICCKVAVIYLALYALRCVTFCSNDCFPRKMNVYSLKGLICSG